MSTVYTTNYHYEMQDFFSACEVVFQILCGSSKREKSMTNFAPYLQFTLGTYGALIVAVWWYGAGFAIGRLAGCRFDSRPGLLRTKVYSAFHPSGVGKWVPAIAGKAKVGMAHSDCGWTCGCAGKFKTMKSLENTCHTWTLLRWWFTTKRRYIKCMHLYLTVFWLL